MPSCVATSRLAGFHHAETCITGQFAKVLHLFDMTEVEEVKKTRKNAR
jgi:hypothetical protein